MKRIRTKFDIKIKWNQMVRDEIKKSIKKIHNKINNDQKNKNLIKNDMTWHI
jgi:hypothetical protein